MADPVWFSNLKWFFRVRACEKELNARDFTAREHGLGMPLVVCLTSYPPRFKQLHLTLRCLLKQTVRPDEVILWIAHDDIEKLTPNILELKSQGLTIKACQELKSYNKLIHALQEDPQRYIVTADDDLYYPADWLEKLTTTAAAHPSRIISHRAHRIQYKADGSMQSYEQWDKNIDGPHEGYDIFATGVGGVLYPPDSLDDMVLQQDQFLTHCPTADDVWFYWMARRKGTVVRHVGPKTRVIEWPGSQAVSLRSKNRGAEDNNGNDTAIANLTKALGRPDTSDQ